MSRLLSEKRIISVDTASVDASAFDNGACVIDSTNNAIKVSNGTNWTAVPIGTETAVTYEALDASGDIDTNLSSAQANTVPSSAAVKSYVDSQPSPIATRAGINFDGATPIGGTATDHEVGQIIDDCGLTPNGFIGNGIIAEVYNYHPTDTFRITADSAVMEDIAMRTGLTASIDLAPGQVIKFIGTSDRVVGYRSI